MGGQFNRRQLISLFVAASSANMLLPRSVYAAEDTRLSNVLQSLQRLSGDKPERIRLLAPEGSQANLEPIIAEFRRTTNIIVDVQLAPVDDINTQILLDQLSGETPYDLAVIATFGMPDLVMAGALRPVDDFEQRFPFAKQSRLKGLYQLGDSFDGRTFGPQVDGDLYVMFYNNAIMQDAGFTKRFNEEIGRDPTPAATWAELDTLMRIAHDPAQQRYGGLLFRTPRYIVWEFWSRMHAAGVLPFDANMKPQLTDSRCIAAVEALISASASLHPTSKTASLVENWQGFARGQTLCNIGWGGSQKYFVRNATNLPAGVTATQLPGIRTGASTMPLPHFNWGWNLAVPRGAKYPELGFLLAAFATEDDISTQAVAEEDGFFDPFQPEHYTSAAIRNTYGEQFLDVHEQGMRGAIPDLYIRGYSQYVQSLSNFLVQADRGFITPLDAMQAVAARWSAITQSLGVSEQTKQWRALLENYPQAYLEALGQ